jgi:hypothetical protein
MNTILPPAGLLEYNKDMLFRKAKTDFLEYLEIEQNRSQKTIQNYDHYLTRLLDFAGDDITISDITPELIRKWRLWLNRLGTNVSDELGKNNPKLPPYRAPELPEVLRQIGHPGTSPS